MARPNDPGDLYDECCTDDQVAHSPVTSTSVTSKSETPTNSTQAVPVPLPAPSPLGKGNSIDNKVKCHNTGRGADHTRVNNANKSFYSILGAQGTVIRHKFTFKYKHNFPDRTSDLGLEVVLDFTLNKGCEWT
ncbi:hypothetical protein CORC01_09100 [Colletotrichum orchidophilum]|uniref:Uncharacterized protein n=1 Tax=Colletotrichum orchidophilum TaxID=1209926 RepID=A0A1G4B2L7_9PEZI|nr:uncharacterized protein CORC01_09100 [Colletotrichum orchidophilum]OHE95668.1 hypothetical protein CORC01_09100 [Colletotrichum orchidophilum]